MLLIAVITSNNHVSQLVVEKRDIFSMIVTLIICVGLPWFLMTWVVERQREQIDLGPY
jgi:hypothetical protein